MNLCGQWRPSICLCRYAWRCGLLLCDEYSWCRPISEFKRVATIDLPMLPTVAMQFLPVRQTEAVSCSMLSWIYPSGIHRFSDVAYNGVANYHFATSGSGVFWIYTNGSHRFAKVDNIGLTYSGHAPFGDGVRLMLCWIYANGNISHHFACVYHYGYTFCYIATHSYGIHLIYMMNSYE